ncbi:metallophosphoesterase [Halostagnicola kamekurae]|uniref:Putative phosphoesterase n=1 Tax=Halostagnicola kamekurae TaxID=619731 RepID=A0A1I6RVU3_9EURY|nr:metallophosphoesterase [Halostagnicola kamekurae]SFS68813.1 putative phosphoesterase [Halostagnicola kamekurae]
MPTTEFSLASRSVFVPDADALVLADVHLGKGAASSVDAPLEAAEDSISRLKLRLESREPSTVVIAGDLLDSFDSVPRGVEADLAELRDLVADAGASLVVTPGNHDTMLEDVFDGTVADEYRLADGETVVCHGHDAPESTAERYIVGHDHPALSVDGRKLPCFLYGPGAYDGADVLVCPAFTRLARGATVNDMYGRHFQSPLIRDSDGFHPAIRDEPGAETLWFPPLGECRRLL